MMFTDIAILLDNAKIYKIQKLKQVYKVFFFIVDYILKNKQINNKRKISDCFDLLINLFQDLKSEVSLKI